MSNADTSSRAASAAIDHSCCGGSPGNSACDLLTSICAKAQCVSAWVIRIGSWRGNDQQVRHGLAGLGEHALDPTASARVKVSVHLTLERTPR